MYKKAPSHKREDRIINHKKNQEIQKHQAKLARRGIKIEDLEDIEDIEEDQKETKISKQDQKMRQKLEEFQKQRERKKEEEAKSKRPPFRVGDYKGFGRFEPGNFYFQLNKGRISLWKISFKNTSCR